MRCPVCGDAELIHEVRDVPYSYKGVSTVIHEVEGDFCRACGESLTGPEETKRVMQAMGDFMKEVNSSLVDPGYLAGVRVKLGLTQQQAARMFGGGINAFSRYETGKAKPPLALVQLFRLLERHPELLRELDESQSS